MNLLTETREMMVACDQSPATVAWTGDRTGQFSGTWAAFAIAADFEYDEGHGSQEIHANLVVVFRDGSWLERSEYDGAEGWEYRAPPLQGDEPLASDEQLKIPAARYT